MTALPHKKPPEHSPWCHLLRNARARLHARIPLERSASLRQVNGLALHAAGLRASVGAQCWIAQDGQAPLLGEVVGFAGQRVIETTVRVKLPEGFQRAEFLLEKGAIDMIVDRRKLREQIASTLAMLQKMPQEALV